MGSSLFNLRLLSLTTSVAVLSAACSDLKTTDSIDFRSTVVFGKYAVKIEDPSTPCGNLTVAQDRPNKSSLLIGLPFAILSAKAAKAAKPEKDPICIYTVGHGNSPY